MRWGHFQERARTNRPEENAGRKGTESFPVDYHAVEFTKGLLRTEAFG